jgi:hypothetical protein
MAGFICDVRYDAKTISFLEQVKPCGHFAESILIFRVALMTANKNPTFLRRGC